MFVVVSGDFGDLKLRAYREHARQMSLDENSELIPCIVEYPDQFVITGPTQSLILSWDPDVAEIEDELETLPNPPAKCSPSFSRSPGTTSILLTCFWRVSFGTVRTSERKL